MTALAASQVITSSHMTGLLFPLGWLWYDIIVQEVSHNIVF